MRGIAAQGWVTVWDASSRGGHQGLVLGVDEADASSHRRRRSLRPYAREFSMTNPAALASVPTSDSSWSVNATPPGFSVK
jgi:hypothetical protein